MTVLFIVLVVITGTQAEFDNDWEQPLNFSCGSSQAIGHIESEFSSTYNDRRWDFGCVTIPPTFETVTETVVVQDSLNILGEPFSYNSSDDWYISGMKSEMSTTLKDRIWGVTSSQISGYKTTDCVTTDWVNSWEAHIDFTVPPECVLTGTESKYSSYYLDRRWKYSYCKLEELLPSSEDSQHQQEKCSSSQKKKQQKKLKRKKQQKRKKLNI